MERRVRELKDRNREGERGKGGARQKEEVMEEKIREMERRIEMKKREKRKKI